MDRLQEIALKYQDIINKKYYFEIARKQKKLTFILSFEKSDFFHMAGLHKVTDVAILHGEPNKQKVFDNIVEGNISYDLLKNSRFFKSISGRLNMVEDIENILDNNQIIFKYIESRNKNSRIEADVLLENAHKMNIVFIFLSDRNEISDIPIMCCRSFFAMEKFDYGQKQPMYIMLKKVKIDLSTGQKTVQYDRHDILQRSKQAPTEQERRSVLAQLNEKKAQLAVNEVLQKKRALEPINKNRQER